MTDMSLKHQIANISGVMAVNFVLHNIYLHVISLTVGQFNCFDVKLSILFSNSDLVVR